jgi:methylenetetrahydrofolate reductase (NADPH)
MGVLLPIIPGVLPSINAAQLMHFSDSCGAEIPRWIRQRLLAYGDDSESIRAFGLDVVTDLCERLLAEGAPALHFYTMNQSAATLEICRRLGLGRRGGQVQPLNMSPSRVGAASPRWR